MPAGSSLSNRNVALAVAAVAILGAGIWLALRVSGGPNEPASTGAPPAATAAPQATAASAPKLPDTAPGDSPAGATDDDTYTDYGTPPAAALEPAGGDLPPPTPPSSDAPEVPEELPQTPEWKLEKSAQLYDRLDERLTRLEAKIAEAERDGDDDLRKRTRVLRDRVVRQRERLEEEMRALRRDIAASSGMSIP